MPYFPTNTEMIYKCRGCNLWFVPGYVSCAVAHVPGTCCHYGEIRTTGPLEPQPYDVDDDRAECLKCGAVACQAHGPGGPR